MNIFNEYRDHIENVIKKLPDAGKLPGGLDVSRITVEPPRDPAHGDISTNAAMILAKPSRMKPRDIAEALAPELNTLPGVESVEIAGPGFINLRLGNAVWHQQLASSDASTSPTTLPRAWPICRGPVGLVETYSTFTLRPRPIDESP